LLILNFHYALCNTNEVITLPSIFVIQSLQVVSLNPFQRAHLFRAALAQVLPDDGDSRQIVRVERDGALAERPPARQHARLVIELHPQPLVKNEPQLRLEDEQLVEHRVCCALDLHVEIIFLVI